MSVTDGGRVIRVERYGTTYSGGRYVDCCIEWVDNQGLQERYLIVQFSSNRRERDRIPSEMTPSAAIDAIHYPRPDKWPYWGREAERDMEAVRRAYWEAVRRAYGNERSRGRSR